MIFNHANAALLVIVLRAAGLASAAAAGGGGVPQRNEHDAASGGGAGTIRKKKAAAVAPKNAAAEKKVAAMMMSAEEREDRRLLDLDDLSFGKIDGLNYVEWTDDEIAALCAKYYGDGEGECASFYWMGCDDPNNSFDNAVACAKVLELVDYLDQPDPNNSECEQFFECEPNDEGKPNGGKKLVGMCKGVVACREKGKNCEKLEAKWEEKMHECTYNSRLFSEEDLAPAAVKYPVLKNDDLIMLKESSP